MRSHYLLACLLGLCRVGGVGAEPALTPDEPVFKFDEIGIYHVGYQLRDAPETFLPTGWTGGLDSPTGAACEEGGAQHGKSAWLLHCPWKGKTGVTFQEFTVALPDVPRITLAGATALRSTAVGKSDGVSYRVLVNGQPRYEANRADDAWQPFSIDLSALAGKTVALRFEVGPGPRDDSSFDFALWADRRLEMPGFAPPKVEHPAPPPLDLRGLASQQNNSVVPPSGFVGETKMLGTGRGVILRYQGDDGALEYHWTPGRDDSLFGEVVLHAAMRGDAPVDVPLTSQARLDWTVVAPLTNTSLAVVPDSDDPAAQAVLTRTYFVDGQPTTVTVRATLQGKSLVFDVDCDRPVVNALEGGVWGPTLRRRPAGVPYYSAAPQFLPKENLFANAFLDWTVSQASAHDGTRAFYHPRTDGSRNLLRERLVYTAAWHLDETLPNLPHAPSPYREDLARRVMLDIWGGSFATIQERLRALTDAGFGPGAAIVHDWQFGGYDNQLPQHVPANAGYGGDPAMRALVESAQRDDIRVALHENYADYYPNAPGFAEENVARRPDGSRETAWLNEGTKIQSFAVRPSSMLALAKTQGTEVMKRYGPNAAYLDVHSSVPPAFHVDFAAGQPGAGQFQAVRSAHEALWAYEREIHGGPVFGEGNAHWYWSGALDGVEAQFGQGWRGAGTSAPLLVDFDLLKIHPLQLNHGMGYYERWWAQGPGPTRGLLSLLDQYRMQEIAYGHEGFLGGEAWHDPGLAWLESHLVPPVTTRTALANPVAIDYLANGVWGDASATVRQGGDFAQVRVRYDHGLTVWANGGGQPLEVDGTNIPPNGWLARGANFQAGTTVRQGVVTDHAETPDSVFVNARPAADWLERDAVRIRPEVAEFTPDGPRKFRVAYRWQADQTVGEDLTCFVHFVPANADDAHDTIAFQQDHALAPPSSAWKSGQTYPDGPATITIPPHVAPGDYRWRVGLYGRTGRLALRGVSDAHRRVILGTLHLAADGTCGFTPTPAMQPDLAVVNPDDRVVDFRDIQTNGSVFVQRVGADWTLRPFPTDRSFTVKINAVRFGAPADTKVTDGWWTLPLTGEKTYRWPVAAK